MRTLEQYYVVNIYRIGSREVTHARINSIRTEQKTKINGDTKIVDCDAIRKSSASYAQQFSKPNIMSSYTLLVIYCLFESSS